jgi:hypothetical protein
MPSPGNLMQWNEEAHRNDHCRSEEQPSHTKPAADEAVTMRKKALLGIPSTALRSACGRHYSQAVDHI